jgi:hypothetical protein
MNGNPPAFGKESTMTTKLQIRLAQCSIERRGDGWHVLDQEGYDVSYITYETKKEALDALKVYREDISRGGMIAAMETD